MQTHGQRTCARRHGTPGLHLCCQRHRACPEYAPHQDTCTHGLEASSDSQAPRSPLANTWATGMRAKHRNCGSRLSHACGLGPPPHGRMHRHVGGAAMSAARPGAGRSPANGRTRSSGANVMLVYHLRILASRSRNTTTLRVKVPHREVLCQSDSAPARRWKYSHARLIEKSLRKISAH